MPEEKPAQTPFGREMERRRIAAGMSKNKAAIVCDVSRSRWGQVELGYESLGKDTNGVEHFKAAPPSRDFVIKVAKGLHWDRYEALQLAGLKPEPEPNDDGPALTLPPNGLLELWPKLNKKQQKALNMTAILMVYPDAEIDFSEFSDPMSGNQPLFSHSTERTRI